jgi:hypothetical protein
MLRGDIHIPEGPGIEKEIMDRFGTVEEQAL